jgi:acylphosphatase
MTQNAAERIRLRIAGHVQGVGFRWFVLRVARDAGLSGWVRNNPDGSVELEAAGSRHAVALLKERVSTGPHASRVDEVSELPVSADQLPEPFSIH